MQFIILLLFSLSFLQVLLSARINYFSNINSLNVTSRRQDFCAIATKYYFSESKADLTTFLAGQTINVAVTPSLFMMIDPVTNEPYAGFTYDLLNLTATRGNFKLNMTVIWPLISDLTLSNSISTLGCTAATRCHHNHANVTGAHIWTLLITSSIYNFLNLHLTVKHRFIYF